MMEPDKAILIETIRERLNNHSWSQIRMGRSQEADTIINVKKKSSIKLKCLNTFICFEV